MQKQDETLRAARDTLMHIAAASRVPARSLRHRQSLEVDLGLDEAEFRVLAERQSHLCERLGSDSARARIDAEELRDLLIWEVLQLTLIRGSGRRYGREVLADVIASAQAELRDDRRR